MTPLWTSAEAAAATGGRATRDWHALGLSIDSRTIAPGEIFVALRDRRDGHDFVADALARGAAAALVDHLPAGLAGDAPLLIVPDVMGALRDLARAARARSHAQVIGVTGSVGKTTTKEMLRAILAGQGRVHAAEKSFNNHWGVPLTLARLPRGADYAVIEIGMNAPGEIAPLARLADLDAALVTTVAPAHLAAFDGIEGIAREKATICAGLRRGGLAVLNGEIGTAPILRRAAEARGARLIRFGTAAGCEARLAQVQVAGARLVVQAVLPVGGQPQPVLFRLNTPGRHFALNGLAALAVAVGLGADPGLATGDLGRWSPVEGRGTRETLWLDGEETRPFDLIDDAYNANPASVGAAVQMLAEAPLNGPRARRIAILGDMLELGPTAPDLHAALAGLPGMAGLDRVHCVGPLARHLWQALPRAQRGLATDTAEAMATALRGQIHAHDIVLVKGSLGVGLRRVVDAIRKMGQAAPSLD